MSASESQKMRTVGRRVQAQPLDPKQDTKANARAWRQALNTPFIPRGVYRFTSHEEADRWLWKMITRKASR